MVTPEIRSVIDEALDSPEKFATGQDKERLRAAFDACCSQIFFQLYNCEPSSRMAARSRLNDNSAENHAMTERSQNLARALAAAIRSSENSLHAKDYDDQVENISSFVQTDLAQLVEVLDA